MPLKSVNLNLIPVLRELLRLRSVSAAGRALGRSPSAISEGLAQLRATFEDPLLVRTGGRMALTPRATDLIAPVEEACAYLEAMLRARSVNPAESERMFVIAAHDFHVVTIGPLLLRLFKDTAPNFQLRFVDLGRDLQKRLTARDIDFAILPDFHLGQLATAKLRHFSLKDDRSVVLMRKGHPLAKEKAVSDKDLKKVQHVAFHPNWESADIRSGIPAFRRLYPVVARVSQIALLPYFLTDSDYVAMAPEGLATLMGPALGLTHRAHAGAGQSVHSVFAWSPAQDTDPAHEWFRGQVERRLVPALTDSQAS